MAEVSTCLLFDGAAEQAATLYVGLVPDSAIQSVRRAGGSVVLVEFTLAGRPHVALNGPVVVPSMAMSLVVTARDQAQSDAIWQAHLDAGSTELRCGWLTDRYGMSWQIVPHGVHDLLFGPDPAANARAFACMQGQIRIDTAAIAAAARGE